MKQDNDYVNLNDISLESSDLDKVEQGYEHFLEVFDTLRDEIESLAREENRHLLEINEALRREIEERKLVELRLSDQLLFREALLNAITNPIAFVDTEGRYIGANRSFLAFAGKESEAILGATRQTVLPKVPDKKMAIYQQAYRCLVEEMTVLNGAAEPRDVMVYGADYHNSRGERDGRVEVLVDVTEHKLLAAKQSEQEQMLIQQSKMAAMGEMIAHIAHQWRQPLNALAEVIGDINESFRAGKLNGGAIDGYVERGTVLAEKMSETIDDFGNFFKPTKKKVLFGVLKSVENTLELLSATLIHSRIAVDVTGDGAVSIFGYENEFSQVLLNIINNARDVLVDNKVENPRIAVVCLREGGDAVIRISDNGGGIPDAVMNKIFDPYFTTKEERSGTGIGLYMAKTIIETNMGGTLRAHNEKGGAVFTISIGCFAG
jgi:signal transduction histidine kinase